MKELEELRAAREAAWDAYITAGDAVIAADKAYITAADKAYITATDNTEDK